LEERQLALNPCVKLIVTLRAELDLQLDVLAERGLLETQDGGGLIDHIVRCLRLELADRGVRFLQDQAHWKAGSELQTL